MKRPPIRAVAAFAAATIAVIGVVALLAPAAAPHAPHAPQSIFQDDDHLLYASDATVARTLDMLKALGVDRIRVTVEWAYIAPDPTSSTEPAGFDATDPSAYPHGTWKRYDRVVEMAQARGLAVDFNVTAPGPLWATGPAPVTTAAAGGNPGDYEPSAKDFGQFVQALGTRYSGTFVDSGTAPKSTSILLPSLAAGPGTSGSSPALATLPRVDFWSIWNEPNQPAWLAPQWRIVAGRSAPNSPRLYRALVDAAVAGLQATGHTPGNDTILIGETAPEGDVKGALVGGREQYFTQTGVFDAMTPMDFLRALYCVSSSYQRLAGAAASALGCPGHGSARSFVAQNPGLFYATGFAHHPYFFNFPPGYSSPIGDFVPLADLGRLESGLDQVFAAYGVNRKLPIYLTEYGYQTNPPDPHQVVSPAEQAAYLNQADYMAWRDPRVRSVAQFLLYDTGPNSAYPPSSFNYWDTFQTGLVYGPGTSLDGRRKPAYGAYRLPIWIATPNVRRGLPVLVWGMLRLAPKDTPQKALIQWEPAHHRAYETIATVSVPAGSREGYFTTRVIARGTGSIRIAWRSATGQTFTSRAVGETPSLQSATSGGGAFTAIQSAFDTSPSQTILPCQFSASELAAAQSSIPTDDQQYDQNLVAALAQARQERADGACSANRQVAATTQGTNATTPLPPAVLPLGGDTRLQIGPATAATDSGLPVPLAILIVLGLLVAALVAALGAARFLGWDPAWAARLRHSLAEAGYRVSGISSAFREWIRR